MAGYDSNELAVQSRPEILIELDKRVCDLVRQQQHQSMSYELQQVESDDVNEVDQDENFHSENFKKSDISITNAEMEVSNIFPGSSAQTFMIAKDKQVKGAVKSKRSGKTTKRGSVPVKMAAWK